MHQSREERLDLTFHRFLATHRFKNDSIAAEYFPILTTLKGKKIKNLTVSLYNTNKNYDSSSSILMDHWTNHDVKLKMLGGVGFIDHDGVTVNFAPSFGVDRMTFIQVDSKRYNMSVYFADEQMDLTCWYIYKMQLELA